MQTTAFSTRLSNPPGYPVAATDRLLTVVIPVADEEGNLLPLTAEITAALQALPQVKDSYEILFVDDRSHDRSREEITEAMRQYPHIRLVCHKHRYGKSQGVRTAARHARGAWMLTIDGDGQNDPADMQRLIATAWEQGTEGNRLVCGVRNNRETENSKKLASRAANAIRRHLLKDESPDAGCALKMYRRDMHLCLPYFDNMHRYDPALHGLYGVPVFFVPVNDRPRRHGISKYTNWERALVGLFDMIGVMWLQRRLKARTVASEEIVPSVTERPSSTLAAE